MSSFPNPMLRSQAVYRATKDKNRRDGREITPASAMTDAVTTGGMAGASRSSTLPYANRGTGDVTTPRQQPVTPSPTSPFTPASLRQRSQSIQDTIYGTQRGISTARTQERVLEGMLTDSAMSPAEQMILRQRLAEARLGRVDALGEINAARGELDLVNRAQMPDARAMSASQINAGRQSLMSQGAMTNDRERRIIENQLRMETNPQMRMQLEDRLSRLAASDAALSRMGQPVTSAEMGDRAASVGRSNEARRSVREAASERLMKIDESRALERQRRMDEEALGRRMAEAEISGMEANTALTRAQAQSALARSRAESVAAQGEADVAQANNMRLVAAADLGAVGIPQQTFDAFATDIGSRLQELDSLFSNFTGGAVASTIGNQAQARSRIATISAEIDKMARLAEKYPGEVAVAANQMIAMLPEPGEGGRYTAMSGVTGGLRDFFSADEPAFTDASRTANLLNNLRAKLETLARGA